MAAAAILPEKVRRTQRKKEGKKGGRKADRQTDACPAFNRAEEREEGEGEATDVRTSAVAALHGWHGSNREGVNRQFGSITELQLTYHDTTLPFLRSR